MEPGDGRITDNGMTDSRAELVIGVYFSGTGNTKFCVGRFLAEYGNSENIFSIEEKGFR